MFQIRMLSDEWFLRYDLFLKLDRNGNMNGNADDLGDNNSTVLPTGELKRNLKIPGIYCFYYVICYIFVHLVCAAILYEQISLCTSGAGR